MAGRRGLPLADAFAAAIVERLEDDPAFERLEAHPLHRDETAALHRLLPDPQAVIDRALAALDRVAGLAASMPLP